MAARALEASARPPPAAPAVVGGNCRLHRGSLAGLLAAHGCLAGLPGRTGPCEGALPPTRSLITVQAHAAAHQVAQPPCGGCSHLGAWLVRRQRQRHSVPPPCRSNNPRSLALPEPNMGQQIFLVGTTRPPRGGQGGRGGASWIHHAAGGFNWCWRRCVVQLHRHKPVLQSRNPFIHPR